jgi:RNA polymerase sigma factor (sigma-70 family)
VPPLSDESLLAGMAAGDFAAATAFVRRYQARVFGLARTVVGNSGLAEDVAQEVFLKAWRHASAYDARRGPVASWLLTITRNAAIDAVRYRHEVPIDPDLLVGMLASRSNNVDGAGASVETVDLLRRALRELPREQSTALVLMVFYGLTAKEVAARDGIPVGTVKTRVRRAVSVLRQRLGVADG